jgi:hypothetical protein
MKTFGSRLLISIRIRGVYVKYWIAINNRIQIRGLLENYRAGKWQPACRPAAAADLCFSPEMPATIPRVATHESLCPLT